VSVSAYLMTMAKLPIMIYPDPILREQCAPIERVDDDLQRFLRDMLETMYDAPGVGLAAPQVGVLRRALVMDAGFRKADGPSDPQMLINPEILKFADDSRVFEEGCLSIPEMYAEVERPASVLVRYVDIDGNVQEKWFEDHAATVVQHEIDHLSGIMFIDYLSRLKRDRLVKKFRKARREAAAL
jgi:peptide deformylase